MRRIKPLLAITTSAVLLGSLVVVSTRLPAVADTANAPSLIISQFKITSSNGQFVSLYNPSNTTLDMSKYQLEYFNHYDLSKATSSKLIALSGSVPPHGYFMVNDSSLQLCYQMMINSASLGFSSTAGFIEILSYAQTNPGGSVTPVLQDYVGWSKTAASGAQTLPNNVAASLLRQPVDETNNPDINVPGNGSWLAVQPAPNGCGWVSAGGDNAPIKIGTLQLLPTSEPDATIESLSDSNGGKANPSLPAADIGLMAPQLTEILPNPAGTGNDATDEYIELYNPNTKPFDLSGFSLRSGITSFHNFTFAPETKLAPKSFTAFYASTAKLSMSNTSGQVSLLDPFGNSLSSTAAYTKAADGVSWARAKGKWYWTTTPTPGKTNRINQPSTKTTKKTTTAKTTTPSIKKTFSNTSLASGSASAGQTGIPIHFGILALVASLALLYGAYEYRGDLANYLRQLRSYAESRRTHRS